MPSSDDPLGSGVAVPAVRLSPPIEEEITHPEHVEERQLPRQRRHGRLFSTLKSAFFHLKKFANIDELRAGLKHYIHYYNHDRIKLKLKGLSPVQHRTQPLTK
jgi:transposase InsO family protein